MNNLPGNTTQDMIDAQCAPIAKNEEECSDCMDLYPTSEMYPWVRYSFYALCMQTVYLCKRCVPKCQWLHNDCGHVRLDIKPCGRIQSPNAQGPWCAEHEKEAEALDAAESEEGNDQKAKG